MDSELSATMIGAGKPGDPAPAGSGRAGWRRTLRDRVVARGIRAMCGPSSAPSVAVAADISLIDAGLRLAWLRVLRTLGVRNFVTASAFGYDFVCHPGDLAAHPYYHRRAYQKELALCAAWLGAERAPVVYDVGANDGFFSTQLVQMLAHRSPAIYAFEPVPTTFARLVASIMRLGLEERVHPVAAAVIEMPQPVRICHSVANSLHAQVATHELNPRAGDRLAWAAGVTLDDFHASTGAFPALVKIDVEGSEAAALRGARRLLARADRPALMFEYNPTTLSECRVTADELQSLLAGYALFYVDDLRGQLLPFGYPVAGMHAFGWICNLFAVPETSGATERWARALDQARRQLARNG